MQKYSFDTFATDYGKSEVKFGPCYINQQTIPANLVLEGGGMRALFSAGVTDYLLDQGILCDTVIGVSGGALTGWAYAAGLIGWTAYVNIKYAPDPRYLSLESWIKTGNAFNRDAMFDQVINNIEQFSFDTYNNSPMRLIAVVSNLETGEAEYHTIEDMKREMDYIIASSSMPLVSQIVEIEGKKFLDGGTCDSIPVEYSFMTGTKKHIVVCTQDQSFVRKPNPLAPIMAQMYKDYPHFVERIWNRHYDYNRTTRMLKRLHESGYCYVLWPEGPVSIDRMESDPDKLFDLYQEGVRVAAKHHEELVAYLESPQPAFPPEAF